MDWNLFWYQAMDFGFTYWREILSVLGVVFSVLIYLLKKRPSYNLIDKIKEDILEVLPELILKVESDGNGQRKKNAVLELVKMYVQKNYKIVCPEEILGLVSVQIESILSTPQRK